MEREQTHQGRSNIQYNVGGSADEGQALNVLAYGDVVEQAIGGSRYIKATKIFITATDEFILQGQNVKIQATGELQLAGGSIVQAMTNKKEIVTGQSMELGVSEKSTIQFDPRGQVNIITPGSVNHKILQDYKLKALGCLSLFAVGGPGALIKNRGVGMSLSTKTVFQAGGTAGTDMFHHLEFLKQAENYRRVFIKALNDEYAFGGSKTGERSWKADTAFFQSVEDFRYVHPTFSNLSSKYVTDFIVLLFWSFGSFVVLTISSKRVSVS